MEATGHYWLSVYSFLYGKGFLIHVINPIQTDGWRKGVEIRKRKNDIIDSILIADLIRYGQFVETRLSDEDIFSLRNLTRFRSYLVESISDLKRKVVCVLDQVFPEYQYIFSNIFGKTSKEILCQFSSPIDFESVSADALAQLLTQLSPPKGWC
jgi:Transposase and inactivated derivatives